MRLVFAGTPDTAVPSLEALVDSSHDVVAVITRPDAPHGRGRRLTPSPVASRASDLGIPVLRPTSLRDPEVAVELGEFRPDCCPVVAYGGLVPATLLEVPLRGWVNLHFSLLPAWRGAAPVQNAILSGDEITGATTFRLTEGLDTGPVFGTVTEAIGARDTSGDVLDRLARAGARLLVHTLDGIEREQLHAAPQASDGVSLAPKLGTQDARVRWDDPALAVDRRIRACTPAPGAWTMLGDQRIGLLPVSLVPESPVLGPGLVSVTRQAVFVGTGSTPVRLGQVRPPGKPVMAAEDWARGARLDRGVRFG